MSIELLDFVLEPSKSKLGFVFLKYFHLLIRCDVVYYCRGKDKKIWIRMPERWVNKKTKQQYCYWPTKVISDEFQETVLQKIEERFSHNLQTLSAVHKEFREKARAKKKL